MIRVLVTGAENIGVTGLATAIFRWGQAFDHKKVVYDYLMLKGLPSDDCLEQIRHTSGEINDFSQIRGAERFLKLIRLFREHRDQLLHINASWCYEAFPLLFLARLAGMKNVAVHSHSSYVDSNRAWIRLLKVAAHYFFRPYIVSRTGLKLACSREAAEWMFGKKVVQNHAWEKVFNSVDLAKYRFDPAARLKHRKVLGLKPDELLVGSIGRLSYAKNYEFLIDVMAELVRSEPKARLLLIGEGGFRTMLEEKANALGVRDHIIFAGSRSDANELLSAMDVFALPSRFEGLPLVLIEAQAAQLPCVVSDRVTRECKLTDLMVYLNTDNKALWVNTIIAQMKIDRNAIPQTVEGEYEVNTSAKKLQQLYEHYVKSN